jgi:predicted RND superfamily exporter protein
VRKLFGASGEYELLLVSAEAPVSDERVAQIESAIRGVSGVSRTWSARTRPHLAFEGEDAPRFAIEPGPPPGAAPREIDRFLRPSPNEAGIWLALDMRVRGLTEARRFVRDLHEALGAVAAPGETIREVGAPSRRVASWEVAEKDGRRTLPWLLGAVVVVPLVFFRSWVGVVFPLIVAGLTTGALLALYQLVHGRIDTWALVLFPLVWSVATMDSLHLYEGSAHGAGAHEQIARTRGQVALPALVTAGTTALSLLTLAFPGAPPLLRAFGLWGALGTMMAYGFTFVLGGALLRTLGARPIPAWPARFVRRTVARARRSPRPFVGAWVLATALAGLGLRGLGIEPSYRHTFAPGVPAGEAARAVERAEDCELVPLEIYLEARTPRQRHPNELVLASVGLADYLATLPETRLTLSAATLLSEWVSTDPRARHVLADPLFYDRLASRVGPLAADPQVAEWLRLDGGVARTEVLLRATSHARKEEILRWIKHYVETSTIGYRVTFGGPSYLEHVMEREGLRGIAWGAVTDLALLVVLMAALLRRARLVAVALAGNVVPVVVLCGLMGAVGIPWSFDLLGMPILVLGLAIDDTVHLLWPLRGRRRELGASFQRSMKTYGVAVIATSVLLASSLAGLTLSGFGVNHELGLLLPAGLLLALAAELTLVPAALSIGRARASSARA